MGIYTFPSCLMLNELALELLYAHLDFNIKVQELNIDGQISVSKRVMGEASGKTGV